MILFYAAGGGLGHATRAISILRRAGSLARHTRLMLTTQHADLAAPYVPCPVDRIPVERFTTYGDYLSFLQDYLDRYQIDLLLLDTFPWGLRGEWRDVGIPLPRLLLARHLHWDNYLKRLKGRLGPFPGQVLLLESQGTPYQNLLAEHAATAALSGPITLEWSDPPPRWQARSRFLVVHSGPAPERLELLAFAQRERQRLGLAAGEVDTLFPEHGIFPGEILFPMYETVVSGVGYNMAAAACRASGERSHLFFPFHRRFDDQGRRLAEIRAGCWPSHAVNGTQEAVDWLRMSLR